MEKLKALVTAEVIKPILETLGDRIDFEYAGYNIDHDVMPRDELKQRVRDIDILVCEYDTIDEEIFDCADNLKFIVCCRGGVKTVIDLDKAMEKGVIVCNNGGRNANAVSDMTMAYILAVNPSILSDTGMDATAVLLATCIASFIGTVCMAFMANLPFALSAGMGLNAFFAYTVVGIMGYPWQLALFAVFVEKLIIEPNLSLDPITVTFTPSFFLYFTY